MKYFYYELDSPFNLVKRELDLGNRSLGVNEIYAETEFTAISTGTEVAAWMGKPPLRPTTTYPRLIGYCNLAKVVRIGTNVTYTAVGDYILTHQSHRTSFICNSEDVLLNVTEQNEMMRKRVKRFLIIS